MNDSDCLLPSAATAVPKRHPSAAAGRYKLWALSAILLLALWSMLTGSVTLKRSAVRRIDDDLGGPALDDLDILEMEERQKVVRRMWDVYRSTARLPKFWQQAFEAAYQELAGDDPDSRASAVAEIARLSLRMADLHPLPQHTKNPEPEIEEKDADGTPRSNSSSSSVKAQ
ncbi:uncharacterized protein LOC122028209 [Zingiber officinale]|uniref:Transmembrane protein n=1 Tax=Zingiber officinale TaxID=94328 RepID=A0A8J5C6C7_ZINOF|nr:uncharacterized protein LOC122028209 [Zingiber officinale]XP_042443172.1 uncharacterized protein LOC122028209 [Zingiber officinale]KAG6473347.1 hypothetical protein ZIOFF_067262 [Zingiber officinale]